MIPTAVALVQEVVALFYRHCLADDLAASP
jgi:hypothetical protein